MSDFIYKDNAKAQLNLLRDQCRACNGTGLYIRVIYGKIYGAWCGFCGGSGQVDVTKIEEQGLLDTGRGNGPFQPTEEPK